MDTYVVNVDSQTKRWRQMQLHLSGYNIEPIRWSATTPEGIVVEEWNGSVNVPDKERRIAIVRTYRSLFEHLSQQKETRHLVLQDDIILTQDPIRDNGSLIHLYGGYTLVAVQRDIDGYDHPVQPLRKREVNPITSSHVCPRAFRIDNQVLPLLIQLLQDETQQICETWPAAFNRHITTYDHPSTARAPNGT